MEKMGEGREKFITRIITHAEDDEFGQTDYKILIINKLTYYS